MSDPLAVLPFALAASGGRVGEFGAEQLVAAGVALLQRSAPLVRALAGRRAAILLPTSPAFVVALAASDGRGAVLINPLAARREVAFQLQDADVGAVFTISALAALVPDGFVTVLLDDAPRTARVVHTGGVADVSLTSVGALDLTGRDDVIGRDEEAAIVYTSAMRGQPLGSIATHRNLIANGRSTMQAAQLGPETNALAILPFSHLFGLTVTLTAPLLAGGRVTPLDRFNPVKAIERLERDGITMLVGVPAVFGAMLSVLERRGAPLRCDTLSVCICGGAALPIDTQERWFDLTGTELRQGYGLTETGPVALFNPLAESNHRGTLGVPFPGADVSIRAPWSHSPEDNALAATLTPEVAHGDDGEICVKGDLVSPGYVRNGHDGLPRPAGWLYSGDRGRRNADGTISFLGLYKPMFTRNGFNIYPREIETAVAEFPGVESVRVDAIPDDGHENAIVIEVSGDVSESEITAWCRERLSGYKQPTTIRVNT